MGIRAGRFAGNSIGWFAGGLLLSLAGAHAAQAEVCTGYFETIKLPAAIKNFVADPNINARVVAYAEDPEFKTFVGQVQDWLTVENGIKKVGKTSLGKAKLRVPGGDKLLWVLKRAMYRLNTRLMVNSPGEITLDLGLAAVNTNSSSAILDLETLQLALVKKLFDSFPATDLNPAAELKTIHLRWNLGLNPPDEFGEHLATLGFMKTGRGPICNWRTAIPRALIMTGVIAGVGGGAAWWWNYEEGSSDATLGPAIKGATTVGFGAAVVSTWFTCRRSVAHTGVYDLEFTRADPIPVVPIPPAPAK